MKNKFSEPLLEPFVRYLRFIKGIPYISSERPITMIDLGCGPNIPFYYFAKKKGIKFKQYIGIDPLLSEKQITLQKNNKEVFLIKKNLKKEIPLSPISVDYVVSFASLEHFDFPKEVLNEAIRLLKKEGKIILTTPTKIAKPILEILEKIGAISSREIHEHKNYFDRQSLKKLIAVKKIKIQHSYFEMGLNNLMVISRY